MTYGLLSGRRPSSVARLTKVTFGGRADSLTSSSVATSFVSHDISYLF